jgi:hypothetical protein
MARKPTGRRPKEGETEKVKLTIPRPLHAYLLKLAPPFRPPSLVARPTVPQCGQTAPSGQRVFSRYSNAAASLWKGIFETIDMANLLWKSAYYISTWFARDIIAAAT